MKKHTRFFFFVLFVAIFLPVTLAGCAGGGGLLDRQPMIEQNPNYLSEHTVRKLSSCCVRYQEAERSSIWIKQEPESDGFHKLYVIYGMSGDTNEDLSFVRGVKKHLSKQGFSVKRGFDPEDDEILPKKASASENIGLKKRITVAGFLVKPPRDYKFQ